MKRWLKRLIAGPELAELERWQVGSIEARRWFAEFEDCVDALDYVSRHSTQSGKQEFIYDVRERMRVRRDTDLVLRAKGAVLALDLYEMARMRSADPDSHEANLTVLRETADVACVRARRREKP